jgi:hypothetical protein
MIAAALKGLLGRKVPAPALLTPTWPLVAKLA